MTGPPVEAWAAQYKYPFRPFARHGRLRGEVGSITFSADAGERISLKVPGDVVDALWFRGDVVAWDSAGVVLLRDTQGAPVAKIQVDDWLPERSLISDTDEVWRRSRLPDVLAAAGVPVRKVLRQSRLRHFADGWTPEAMSRLRALTSLRTWPWWVMVLRLVLLFSFGAVLIGTAITERITATPATAMSLLLTAVLLCEVIPVLRDVMRDRRTRPSADIWRPFPGITVRRAFRRTACVRRTEDAIALVTSEGSERWLPRTGPGAVSAVAHLRMLGPDPDSYVVLLDDQQRIRAALPSASWTDGRSDGCEHLASFLGVPVVAAGHPTVGLHNDREVFDGSRVPHFGNGVLMFNPADPVAVFSPILVLVTSAPKAETPTPVVVLAVSLLIGSWGRGLIRGGARRWWWSALVKPVPHASTSPTARSRT